MKRTPLYNVHQDLNARFIKFGEWEMPVSYKGILEEHRAVRNNCGLFDVSHMGEIVIEGENAPGFVNKLVTRDVSRLEPGQINYTLICNEKGGIIDDILVYRLKSSTFLLVVNAANTVKDYQWCIDNSPDNVSIKDVSSEYVQLAVQGPKSRALLEEFLEINLEKLEKYHFIKEEFKNKEIIISRTGYTGEIGYELYIKPGQAETIWKEIMETGNKYKLLPAGLGARDTLRLEKGMRLYGNDIDESVNPLEAGLGWTVASGKDFIGKKALDSIKDKGLTRKLVGFKMVGRGIPRPGYKIRAEAERIGEVTSGSFSPTLAENIGLGYVKVSYSEKGQKIFINIRNNPVEAVVVDIPFVK